MLTDTNYVYACARRYSPARGYRCSYLLPEHVSQVAYVSDQTELVLARCCLVDVQGTPVQGLRHDIVALNHEECGIAR